MYGLFQAIYGLAETLEKNKITIKRSVSFNAKEMEISSKIQELQVYICKDLFQSCSGCYLLRRVWKYQRVNQNP